MLSCFKTKFILSKFPHNFDRYLYFFLYFLQIVKLMYMTDYWPSSLKICKDYTTNLPTLFSELGTYYLQSVAKLMKKVIRCYRVTQWQTNLINTILLWTALGNLAHFIGKFVVNFRDNFKDNLMNNFGQNFRKILWYFSIFSVLFLTKKEAKLVIG